LPKEIEAAMNAAKRGKPRGTRKICGVGCTRYYHNERNHQSLSNRLIQPEKHVGNAATVQRRQRLGGMLNSYY